MVPLYYYLPDRDGFLNVVTSFMTAVSLRGRFLFVADWRPLSLFSSGPGYDYWLQKNCGLSVGVNRAKYCLNRNSCAALYPDVANRVCMCVCEVDCGVCWPGWAMWLSCHGWLLSFLSWSIVMMQRVFFLYLPEIMNMQKNMWSQTRYQLKG